MNDFNQIKVQVGNQIVEENLIKSLTLEVNDEDIIEKMCKSPARFAYWLRVNTEQKRIVKELEDEFEHWQVSQKNKIRQTMDKKVTETLIKEQVMDIPEYRDKKKKLDNEFFKLEEIGVAIQSYKHFMEMTRSIGAMRRTEIQSYFSGSTTPDTNSRVVDLKDLQ